CTRRAVSRFGRGRSAEVDPAVATKGRLRAGTQLVDPGRQPEMGVRRVPYERRLEPGDRLTGLVDVAVSAPPCGANVVGSEGRADAQDDGGRVLYEVVELRPGGFESGRCGHGCERRVVLPVDRVGRMEHPVAQYLAGGSRRVCRIDIEF